MLQTNNLECFPTLALISALKYLSADIKACEDTLIMKRKVFSTRHLLVNVIFICFVTDTLGMQTGAEYRVTLTVPKNVSKTH